MNFISAFWIELYLSWVTIEFLVSEGVINMKENTKQILMVSIGLLLCFIAWACSGEAKEERTAEQILDKYADVRSQHDKEVAEWNAYFDSLETPVVDLDTLLERALLENENYVPDSSNVLAIKYPDDHFTDFEQAFSTARAKLGKDKYFIWLGEIYSTNYIKEGYPPRVYQSKTK